MSSFSKRFPDLRPGEYEEFGVPTSVLSQLPKGVSIRVFATPSRTHTSEGYFLQAIKSVKAGWSNRTATILCSCPGSMLRCALVLLGIAKTPCSHARGLRAALKRGL